MREVMIAINEAEELRRFKDAVRNCPGEKSDELLHHSFLKWLNEGLEIMRERVSATSAAYGEAVRITLQLPDEWIIHSAPGMKYSLRELIFNGMMSGWYYDADREKSEKFRRSAELNKAELKSIMMSLDM